jgi:hypothetical protein
MNLERAISFVQTNGSSLERARLATLTRGADVPWEALGPLLALQNGDGGWPLRLQVGLPSALSPTCMVLGWLAELEELERPEAERAFAFISGRQRSRGLWREDPALQAHDPPPWMDPESSAGDVYTTALCASTLATLSSAHDLDADRATTWLQTQVGQDGLLPGFGVHSTWLALPCFARFVGLKSKTTRRMVVGLAQQLSADWTGSMLAWMLNSLADAGYRRTTQLVDRAAAQLEQSQRPDGGWSSEDEGFEVDATVEAVRAIRRVGDE